MSVTIYHNPKCSKSRAALALIRERGLEPRVIEYLKEPPTANELRGILRMLGATPRALLRQKEARAAGLDDPRLSDEEIIAGMLANPITIERPIVVSGNRARLGRPPESILEIL